MFDADNLFSFYYETKIMKLESLLVDCCVVESSEQFSTSCLDPLHLIQKNSSFLCQPIFAVNFLQQERNQSPPVALSSPLIFS
jgi:hypothetical protein